MLQYSEERRGLAYIRHISPSLKFGSALILDGANSIQDQIGDDTEASVGALENQGSRCVLARGVPASDDEDEAWRNAAFKESL